MRENYLNTYKNFDLEKRPGYWGGYKFIPYEFEFWVGHKHRLNKRTLFTFTDNGWMKKILQP